MDKSISNGTTSGIPKVSIIVLTRNRKNDLRECLESLKKLTYLNYDVIVVDNDSTDGTIGLMQCYRDSVEFIETGKNLGFSAGNNVGIKRALEKGADYLLLLNDDTIVDPGFLNVLVNACEKDASVGIAGPKIYLYAEPRKLWATADIKNIRKIDEGQENEDKYVDYVVGCAFFIRREVVEKVGFLDEDLFLYREEDVYCTKARNAGYKIMFLPRSIIWHKAPVLGDHLKPYQVYYNCRNSILVRNAVLIIGWCLVLYRL